MNIRAPTPCPLAAAMLSILCVASQKVSAQEKRKCDGANTKSPRQKAIYSRLQNSLMEEPKPHTRTRSHTKTKTTSGHSSSPLAVPEDKATGNKGSRASCQRTSQNSAQRVYPEKDPIFL